MDIQADWPAIRKHFRTCFRANFHVAVASVDQDNHPTVTPIGSLFLNHDQTGFYFEKFPAKLPESARSNRNICVLAVNSNTWFWLTALFKGRFNSPPAIKLYGQLGVKRAATAMELQRLQNRMKTPRGLKGHAYLWGDMTLVREISFHQAEKINLGRMTAML